MVFHYFFLQIFTKFLQIYQFIFFISLTGHSCQPATRQEKRRDEIFNPPSLVCPPRTVFLTG
jgi:hypothetical protein